MAYNISLCCIFEFNTKILFYKTCLQFFFSVSKTYSLKEKAVFLYQQHFLLRNVSIILVLYMFVKIRERRKMVGIFGHTWFIWNS